MPCMDVPVITDAGVDGFPLSTGILVLLAFTLALGDGKLTKELLIHTAYKVVLLILQRVEFVDLVEQRGELRSVKAKVGIVVGGQGSC